MTVSRHDREYMRRIAAIKQVAHAEALARHRALPIRERLRRSWELYVACRPAADVRGDADDPTPFYERARRLGLYDP